MTETNSRMKSAAVRTDAEAAAKHGKHVPPYDLEERTFQFAWRVRAFVRKIPRTLSNAEDARQLIRASGSVGANYVEANDALGRKDFVMHVRITRKEAKESRYWLRLLYLKDDATLEGERKYLIEESTELICIFSSIITKST